MRGNRSSSAFLFCIGLIPSETVGNVFFATVLVLSLLGNLIIVAVFVRDRARKTPVHYFIANMAISDLLVPVIVLPWQISNTYLGGLWLIDGALGTIICKFVGIVRGIYPCVSILSMVAISVERFCAILFPMKTALIQSRKTSRYVLVAIWLISILMRVHYLYAYQLRRIGPSNLLCMYRWSPKSYSSEMLKINWLLFLSLGVVSATLLTTLYLIICLYLCSKKQNSHMGTETIKRREAENRKVIIMLVTTTVFFYAIYTPYHVFAYFFYLKRGTKLPCSLLWVSKHLHFLYTVFNPFAYYVYSQHYRQGVQEMFGCIYTLDFKIRKLSFNMHRCVNVTYDVTISGKQNTKLRTTDTAL